MTEETTIITADERQECPVSATINGEEYVSVNYIGNIIKEMMMPVVSGMNMVIEQNTRAVQMIAQQQEAQARTMAELEREVRFSVPLAPAQVNHINAAIRDRAKYLLDKNGLHDSKRVTKLSNVIRKAVLARYGVSSIREVPKCEYQVAMQVVHTWLDALKLMEIVSINAE